MTSKLDMKLKHKFDEDLKEQIHQETDLRVRVNLDTMISFVVLSILLLKTITRLHQVYQKRKAEEALKIKGKKWH